MLTTHQLILLENIAYTYDSKFPYNYLQSYVGQTLKDYIDIIDLDYLRSIPKTSSFILGYEFAQIIEKVKNDSQLSALKILTCYKEPIGGGFSIVYHDQKNHEAIIVFKGTQGPEEWQDNFRGATITEGEDQVSTPIQINSKLWVDEVISKYHLENEYITIIGHSKGGNKAKYATLFNEHIDRCVALDGQGFSDQFFALYHDQIKANQHKIRNTNVNYDYVNLLLNDVGRANWYQGYGIGNAESGFFENHSPNSFLNHEADLAIQLDQEGRGKLMKEADELINGMVRFLPIEERIYVADFVYALMHTILYVPDNEQLQVLVDLVTCDDYKHYSAFAIAYCIKFLEKMPNLRNKVVDALKFYQLEKFEELIKMVTTLLKSPFIDETIALCFKLLGNLSIKSKQKIIHKLEKEYGITIDEGQLQGFIRLLILIPPIQKEIILQNGADLVVD